MPSLALLRCCKVLLAGVAYTSAAALAADLRELNLDGLLHNAEKTRPAKLHLFCVAQPSGGFGVELIVPEAEALKDFGYDTFEGPDAPASKRALSRISLSGESGKTEIIRAAGGWYGVAPEGSFVFSVTQLAFHTGEAANLLGALDGHRGHLVWVQTSYDDTKRELRGAFEFDDAMAKRMREIVAPCLPTPAAHK